MREESHRRGARVSRSTTRESSKGRVAQGCAAGRRGSKVLRARTVALLRGCGDDVGRRVVGWRHAASAVAAGLCLAWSRVVGCRRRRGATRAIAVDNVKVERNYAQDRGEGRVRGAHPKCAAPEPKATRRYYIVAPRSRARHRDAGDRRSDVKCARVDLLGREHDVAEPRARTSQIDQINVDTHRIRRYCGQCDRDPRQQVIDRRKIFRSQLPSLRRRPARHRSQRQQTRRSSPSHS